MSIKIFAWKFPNVIIVVESYKRLTITLLHVSCMLVSCVRISEQGVWCWWLTGTGTKFRYRYLSIKGWVIQRPVKLYLGGRPTFFTFFPDFKKNMTFYVFWVVAHVFSNTALSSSNGFDAFLRWSYVAYSLPDITQFYLVDCIDAYGKLAF